MSGILLAIEQERMYQIRILLSREDVKVNMVNEDGQTPLIKACLMKIPWKAYTVTTLLLKRGARLTTFDKWKRTCLTYTCINGKDDLLNLVLETEEIPPNTIDITGRTNLMYAILSGSEKLVIKLVYYLCKYKLSLDERTTDGFTAYMLALKKGFFKLAFILKKHGASTETFDYKHFRKSSEWAKTGPTNKSEQFKVLPPRTMRRKDSQNISVYRERGRQRSMTAPPMVNLEYLNFIQDVRWKKSKPNFERSNTLPKINQVTNLSVNMEKSVDPKLSYFRPVAPLSNSLNVILTESVLTKQDSEEANVRSLKSRLSRQIFAQSPALMLSRQSLYSPSSFIFEDVEQSSTYSVELQSLNRRCLSSKEKRKAATSARIKTPKN